MSKYFKIIAEKNYYAVDTFNIWITLRDTSTGRYKYLRPLTEEDFVDNNNWQLPVDSTFELKHDQVKYFFQSISKTMEQISAYLPSEYCNTKEVEAMKKHIQDLSSLAKGMVDALARSV